MKTIAIIVLPSLSSKPSKSLVSSEVTALKRNPGNEVVFSYVWKVLVSMRSCDNKVTCVLF